MNYQKLIDFPSPEDNKIGWPWAAEIPGYPPTMPDGSSWPRLSIVTPSFNQAMFLEETIRSVLLQGYPNLEYIIIDGGSTDGSVEIIKKYEPWLTYWVSEPDDGQTYAILKGMEHTTGDLLNWVNSDDYLLPGALTNLALLWRKISKPAAVLCGGGFRIKVGSNKIVEVKSIETDEKILPMAPPVQGGIQASWFISRQAWEQVGGINKSLNYTMDTDLYYRLNLENIPFITFPRNLAVYREHENTKTILGWKESIAYKHGFYYFWLSTLAKNERKYYSVKVQNYISSLYIRSISPGDPLIQRIGKVARAFLTSPKHWLKPLQLFRLFRLVSTSHDIY